MTKKIALTLAASCLTAFAGFAQAQSNTITFNGEVVATTCNPAVTNGNYTVTLDQVARSVLTASGPGQYAALSVPFAIQVVDCPAGVNTIGAVLDSSTYDAVTGNLNDLAGYGSNAVQIQIMDGTVAAQQVVIGAAAPVSSVAVVDGAASIPMTAHYFVNDVANVEVGKIKTTAVYALRTE